METYRNPSGTLDPELNKVDGFVDTKTDKVPESEKFEVQGYTEKDAEIIAEGVREAGVINPHKGEPPETEDIEEEVDRIRKSDQIL